MARDTSKPTHSFSGDGGGGGGVRNGKRIRGRVITVPLLDRPSKNTEDMVRRNPLVTRRQVSHFDFLLSAYFSVLSFHPCCAPRRVQGHELCMVDLMDG